MKLEDMPLSYVGREVQIQMHGDTILSGVLTSLTAGADEVGIAAYQMGLPRPSSYYRRKPEVSLDNGRIKAKVPLDAIIALKENTDDQS